MHLVLRSIAARGEWSFLRAKNKKAIAKILEKFSRRFGVRILSTANVGNHIHLQIQLTSRYTYRPFIRAVTAAIAMAVTGRNRWTSGQKNADPSKRSAGQKDDGRKIKFWDYRPFTRVVIGFKALLGLKDYIRINQFEGAGFGRATAEFFVKRRWSSA
jgi:REP element-mobilizing transposase RayT